MAGKFKLIENTERKFNENDSYYEGSIKLTGVEGETKNVNIMLTKRQMADAIKRSKRNPEDITDKSWFYNLFG